MPLSTLASHGHASNHRLRTFVSLVTLTTAAVFASACGSDAPNDGVGGSAGHAASGGADASAGGGGNANDGGHSANGGSDASGGSGGGTGGKGGMSGSGGMTGVGGMDGGGGKPPAGAGECVTSSDVDNLPTGHWCRVPNSDLDAHKPTPLPPGTFKSIMLAWNGGAYDTLRDRLIIWGGGHGDYAGNEIFAFDMNTLDWTRVTEPSRGDLSAVGPLGPDVYLDGLPRSRHTYNHIQHLPNIDRFFALGACCHYPGSVGSSRDISTYDFNANGTAGWETGVRATRPSGGISTSMTSAYHPSTGMFWLNTRLQGASLLSYDPIADVWQKYTGGKDVVLYKTADIDVVRNRYVFTGGSDSKTYYYDLANPSAPKVQAITSGNKAMEGEQAPGFVYDATHDRFVAWSGGANVYILNPQTWAWSQVTPASGNITIPTSAEPLGTYGRFRYVASKDVYVVVNRTTDDVFIYRL